eukprot:c10054_g1_i1.p1 GENE.c10054_g1_i1~~c10054_g1_i1.p1  ORF type:complete len:794 (+),score=143.07 c10054_g1_i1:22-2382(+)
MEAEVNEEVLPDHESGASQQRGNSSWPELRLKERWDHFCQSVVIAANRFDSGNQGDMPYPPEASLIGPPQNIDVAVIVHVDHVSEFEARMHNRFCIRKVDTRNDQVLYLTRATNRAVSEYLRPEALAKHHSASLHALPSYDYDDENDTDAANASAEVLDSHVKFAEASQVNRVASPSKRPFTTAERLRIAYQIMTAQVTDPIILRNTKPPENLLLVTRVFLVHDRDWNEKFLERVKHSSVISGIPHDLLNEARGHFGEKVTIYFSWMQHYNTWLLGLALLYPIEIILYLTSLAAIGTPLFGMAVTISSIYFLRTWDRKYNAYLHIWNIQQVSENVWKQRSAYDPNPKFPKGSVMAQVITLVLLGVQIALLCVLVMCLFVVYVIAYEPACVPPAACLPITLGLSVVWGLVIELLNYKLFRRAAEWLAELKNHKLKLEFVTDYTWKIFIFFFMDCYLWYFILCLYFVPALAYYESSRTVPDIIVYLCDAEKLKDKPLDGPEKWISRAWFGLFTFLITQPAILWWEDYGMFKVSRFVGESKTKLRSEKLSRLLDKVKPSRRFIRLQEEADKTKNLEALELRARARAEAISESTVDGISDTRRFEHKTQALLNAAVETVNLEDVWAQSELRAYSTFYDMADMTTQFGYIVFFSIVCPSASLICWVNNLFELRGDINKLCNNEQRPVPSKTVRLSVWTGILQLLSCLGALVTSATVALGTRYSDELFTLNLSETRPVLSLPLRVYIMVIIEHVLLALMYCVHINCLKQAKWVSDEQQAAATLNPTTVTNKK